MCLDGGPIFSFNESVSFLVDCRDQAEIDYYWDILTKDGGKESECGWLKDKYGLSWQITPPMEQYFNQTNPEGAKRATEAMLKMKKLDMATLQAAYEGTI